MLSLRPATFKDAELLLTWRNDLESRRQSQDDAPISLEHHIAWLTTSLAMPGRKLYIAEHDGTPIGTVRSDAGEDGAVELSWTIAPSERGKGFGKIMVTQFVREKHPGAQLRASIRKGNVASEKIAHALGLHEAGLRFPDKAPIEYPLMLWR